MHTITNSALQSQCYKSNDKPKKKVDGFGAYMASATASGAIATIPSLWSLKLLDKMKQIGTMDDSQIKSFHDTAENVLKNKGLGDKVKIHYHKEVSTPMKITDLLNPMSQVEHGFNAFFSPSATKVQDLLTGKKILIAEANTIHVPEKSIAYTILHEVGHCLNYNLSKFGRILQKARPVSLYVPAFITLYATLTRKSKPDENGNYTKGQKANNFIRNNAGILSLIAGIPMLAEEAMATIKGKNFAKKFLSPELVKKYTKGTRTAYLSYLSMAVFGALAAHTATKVKDNAIAKKEAEARFRDLY